MEQNKRYYGLDVFVLYLTQLVDKGYKEEYYDLRDKNNIVDYILKKYEDSGINDYFEIRKIYDLDSIESFIQDNCFENKAFNNGLLQIIYNVFEKTKDWNYFGVNK